MMEGVSWITQLRMEFGSWMTVINQGKVLTVRAGETKLRYRYCPSFVWNELKSLARKIEAHGKPEDIFETYRFSIYGGLPDLALFPSVRHPDWSQHISENIYEASNGKQGESVYLFQHESLGFVALINEWEFK